MTHSRLLRPAAVITIISALSGCGAAGTGGGSDSAASIAPLQGMSSADYQRLQNRGVVAQDGEPTEFSSFATTYTSSADFDEPVGRREDAVLIVSAGREVDGDVARAPSVDLVRGDLRSRNGSFNPDYNQQNNPYGEPTISGETSQVAGQEIYVGSRAEGLRTTQILYLPRGDSDMYAGGYIYDGAGRRAYSGIFGRETTREEMARLRGTAEYNGVGAVSVLKLENRNQLTGNGLYEGGTSATVNFDRNQIAMQGSFDRARSTDRIGSDGQSVDTVTMTAQGGFNSAGEISAQANYGGLQTQVTGDVEGNFFGPNGESIGVTMIGSGEGANDEYGRIVGQSVMNSSRD